MLGFMEYNKTASTGFTDNARGRCATAANTCPVCLLRFDASGGTLPDGTVLTADAWKQQVCTAIKDTTVNGGFQGGCAAHAYAPF